MKNISLVSGPGGLPMLQIKKPQSGSSFEMLLQGAQITKWYPPGKSSNLFWVSEKRSLLPGYAVRGGNPICGPYYGPREGMPRHGVFRLLTWAIRSVRERREDEYEVVMYATSTPLTLLVWPHDFQITCTVVVGEYLSVNLFYEGNVPADIAMHPYFGCAADKVKVFGLENSLYLDAAEGFAPCGKTSKPIIFAGDTINRIYSKQNAVVQIGGESVLTFGGTSDVVVWHPSAQDVQNNPRLSADIDLGSTKKFICVEPLARGVPSGGHVLMTIRPL